MSDFKISELDALGGTPDDADILAIVDDVAGTPITKKVTVANLLGTVPVKATGAELDTGTDDAKFATAKAIADSKLSYTDGTETLTNKTLTTPAISNPTGLDSTDVGLANVDNTSDATKNSATATLTNKRTTARVKTFTSDATPDIDSDDYDAVTITAQAVAITDVNVTGTPTNFQKIMFRIKDNGTLRAIAWGTDFEAGSQALPDTTVAGKTLLVGFIYDSVDSKWACEATGSRE